MALSGRASCWWVPQRGSTKTQRTVTDRPRRPVSGLSAARCAARALPTVSVWLWRAESRLSESRSSKPAGRSSPPLGWFDSIAAPWAGFRSMSGFDGTSALGRRDHLSTPVRPPKPPCAALDCSECSAQRHLEVSGASRDRSWPARSLLAKSSREKRSPSVYRHAPYAIGGGVESDKTVESAATVVKDHRSLR